MRWLDGITDSIDGHEFEQAPGVSDGQGSPITNQCEAPYTDQLTFFGQSHHITPWKESYDQPRQHIEKQRHYFANKGPSSQGYVFSSSHVWM